LVIQIGRGLNTASDDGLDHPMLLGAGQVAGLDEATDQVRHDVVGARRPNMFSLQIGHPSGHQL